MANIFKIVFLGLAGFALLVYLTAEKPKYISDDENVVKIIQYNYLPDSIQVVGKEKLIPTSKVIDKNQDTLLIVANHDSLSVVKELPSYFKIDIPYVMIANVSSAPWFVKKLFIPSKLDELNKGSIYPMISDYSGEFVNMLNINDSSKTRFFAFISSKDGVISKIYEGKVKDGAIDGSMNEKEKKEVLKPIFDLIN